MSNLATCKLHARLRVELMLELNGNEPNTSSESSCIAAILCYYLASTALQLALHEFGVPPKKKNHWEKRTQQSQCILVSSCTQFIRNGEVKRENKRGIENRFQSWFHEKKTKKNEKKNSKKSSLFCSGFILTPTKVIETNTRQRDQENIRGGRGL